MAMSRFAVAVTMSLVVLTLSGCIGDDTPDKKVVPDDVPVDPVATKETGSITGTIISDSLELLGGVRVALVKGEATPLETTTKADGVYTMNDVAPGTYVLQASKPLYREVARSVEIAVETITTVHVEMQRLSDAELGVVYSDGPNSIAGLLGCGAGFSVDGESPSGSINPCALDENNKNGFEFEVGEGLKTLIVAMTWQPVGGISGERLKLIVETNTTDPLNPTRGEYTYAETTDVPDIVLRIDEDDITESKWAWSNITGSRTISLRVFPGQTTPPTTTYQQSFTIWWEAWYNGEAPEGRDPVPDS